MPWRFRAPGSSGRMLNTFRVLAGLRCRGRSCPAVTVQNEVDTDQDGRMPACSWPQEYEIRFVKDHLGPLSSRMHFHKYLDP